MRTNKLTKLEREIYKGKVLWFDERDGHGIIEDEHGNEYYSDTSATPNREPLKRNEPVEFYINPRIKDCKCAVVTKRGA